MPKRTPFLAALVLASAPALAQETQQRSDLAWKHEAGQELYYAYTWKLEQTQEIDQILPPTPSLYQITYTLTEKVTGVADGVATVEAEITSLRVKLVLGMMMGAQMAYDSTQPDDGVNPLRPFRHVVGETFRFKLDRHGRVSETGGGTALLERLNEKAGAEVAAMGPMGGQLLGLLAVVFSDESLGGSLQIVNEVLPTTPQSEGDTFESQVDMELPAMGRMRFTAENTVGATKKGRVELSSEPKGEVTIERDDAEGDDGAAGGARDMGRQLAEGQTVTRREARRVAHFSTRHGRLEDCTVSLELDSEGPPPAEMAMMLGEQAKDAVMKQKAVLTLLYERGQTPGGN